MKSSIRWILISSFIASIVVFTGVLVYGFSQFEDVRDLSRDIVQSKTTKYQIVTEMLSAARERLLDLYAMVNSDDPFYRDELFLDFNKQGAIFADARERLIEQELSEEESTILITQGKHTNISVPIQNQLIDLIQNDEIEQARLLLNESGEAAQNRVLDELKKLLNIQLQDSHHILNEIDQQYERSLVHILTLVSIAFVLGTIVAILIIIKLSRIEHRLFEEIENTRATLASVSDALLKVNTQGQIVFANIKATELFGEHLLDNPVTDTLPFIEMQTLFSPENSRVRPGLFTVTTQTGNIWVELMLESIRDENGNETGKLIVLHDQTEVVQSHQRLESLNESLEKRVQERTRNLEESNARLEESLASLAQAHEQLVQSEKMAALGSLVAGISHEINTPIGIGVTTSTNIEESIESLEQMFSDGTLTRSEFENRIGQTRKGLDILIRNLRRASELIKSFKQVAVDQSSDELREIDVREYCDEIILSLQPKLKTTNIQLDNNIPEGIRIYTNPGALYQILSNLIMNSLVHAFDQPLDNETISLNAMLNNSELVFEYKDNGKGADEETLKKIFDPFFTTKRGQGGSGLGMNVVYNLVTSSLKGKIDVQSEEDRGIAIKINMPVSQTQPQLH